MMKTDKNMNKERYNSMRLFFFLFALNTNLVCYCQLGFLEYPTFEAINKKLYENYNLSEFSNSIYKIDLAKKPEGWRIIIREYNDIPPTIIKDELFWERRTKSFNELSINKIVNINEKKINVGKRTNSKDARYYNICPYYGYDGWELDVISEYNDTMILPDSVLYGLGRAFSSQANILMDGYCKNYSILTLNQIEDYKYFRYNAINCFQKVFIIDSTFQTVVGSIKTKLSNECVFSYLDLRLFLKEDLAKYEMPENLYNPLILAYANNLLNSCDSNSILITSGDNITCSLNYLQTVFGVRQDILVIEYQWLNNLMYIKRLRLKYLTDEPLELFLSDSTIKGLTRNPIYLTNDKQDGLNVSYLLNYISSDSNLVKDWSGKSYFNVPSKNFYVSNAEEIISWSNQQSSYISLNNIILSDIIFSNIWQRPIFFTHLPSLFNTAGLENEISLEGFTYKLNASKLVKYSHTNYSYENVGTSEMYDKIFNVFIWSGMKGDKGFERYIYDSYRHNFAKLAFKLIEEKRTDSAKMVLDKCLEVAPNELSYFDDSSILNIVKLYYELNEFDKANYISNLILDNYKTHPEIFKANINEQILGKYLHDLQKKIKE